jgi:hypothetical protein
MTAPPLPQQLLDTPFAWPLAQSVEQALEHVTLARAAYVRVQEAHDRRRASAPDERASGASALNLRTRVQRALALGASYDQVLAAAGEAYHPDRCQVCGRIFRTSCTDPRFRGMCGDCLVAPY